MQEVEGHAWRAGAGEGLNPIVSKPLAITKNFSSKRHSGWGAQSLLAKVILSRWSRPLNVAQVRPLSAEARTLDSRGQGDGHAVRGFNPGEDLLRVTRVGCAVCHRTGAVMHHQ